MASVNTRSNGRSQIGQRSNAPTNPLLAFIVEPTPASQLTPELVYGRVKFPSIRIGMALEGTAFPPTIRGTMALPVRVRSQTIGIVPVNGAIVRALPIRATISGFAKPNGMLRGTVKITANGVVRVVPFNYGTINRQVIIRFSNDAGDVLGVNNNADQFSTGDNGDLLGY
ncbi:MAG: hypothetical protein EOO77_30190 [Oxalobacteraceae bacterium]|nr:MAG: hypothetical protein EOO77_30190 [Oxalobacteraceae bacterium]